MFEYLSTLPALYGPFLLCIFGFWFNLRVWDRLGGIQFREHVLPQILAGNVAVSLYFTGRLIAFALLWAGLFGVVR